MSAWSILSARVFYSWKGRKFLSAMKGNFHGIVTGLFRHPSLPQTTIFPPLIIGENDFRSAGRCLISLSTPSVSRRVCVITKVYWRSGGWELLTPTSRRLTWRAGLLHIASENLHPHIYLALTHEFDGFTLSYGLFFQLAYIRTGYGASPAYTQKLVIMFLLTLGVQLLALALSVVATSRTSPPSGALVVRAGTTTSGEYATVSAAVAALPNDSSSRSIFIYPGTYQGQVLVQRSGPTTVCFGSLLLNLTLKIYFYRSTVTQRTSPTIARIKLSLHTLHLLRLPRAMI